MSSYLEKLSGQVRFNYLINPRLIQYTKSYSLIENTMVLCKQEIKSCFHFPYSYHIKEKYEIK